MEIKTTYKDNKDNIEIQTNNGYNNNNIFEESAHHNLLLFYSCLADDKDLDKNTKNIAKFDIMKSSLFTNTIFVGSGFLINTAI